MHGINCTVAVNVDNGTLGRINPSVGDILGIAIEDAGAMLRGGQWRGFLFQGVRLQ